jgi:hypothetical protein
MKCEIILVNMWRAKTVPRSGRFPIAVVGLDVPTASCDITAIFTTSWTPPKQNFDGLISSSFITENVDERCNASAG